ncbi:hypothetical protein DPMN_131976 [Dreissena polymorpha]|uniref:Uncharacterized protein n=1 Tax=Dreissena polymorpha TaxID=45954 RepID=A0A9D4FQQ5_DREPO|nr:hypothetical protein DPMN_131976 [Dreissena polymorpha]
MSYGHQGLCEMNDNVYKDSPACALQVIWSSEEVFSTIAGYTRQIGWHQACQQRTRSTACASCGSVASPSRINTSSEEKTLFRTLISLSTC